MSEVPKPVTVRLPNGEVRYSYAEALEFIDKTLETIQALRTEASVHRKAAEERYLRADNLSEQVNAVREATARRVLLGTGLEPAKVAK